MMLFILALTIGAFSQDATFRHYSSDEGFTGAAFKTIAQDSLGYIWISTGTGLSKFDGYNFTGYRLSISNRVTPVNSQSQNLILKVDPKGKVWAALNNYIAWFDQNKDSFVPYLISDDANVESICFDNGESIWIGINGKGLTRFDLATETKVSFLNQTEENDKFNYNNIIQDIADIGNSLLIGSKNGLWIFDKDSKLFSRPRCSDGKCLEILSGDIKQIFFHTNAAWLWIGQELIKVNTDFIVLQRFNLNTIQQQFDFEKRFVDARVLGIAEDKEGNFWIASQGLGLSYYDPQRNMLSNYRNNKDDVNSLQSDVLNKVAIDRDQNVWVSSINKGIILLKRQSLVFHNYLNGISSTGIAVIEPGHALQIVAGTNGSSIWKSDYDRTNISRLKFKPVEMSPPVRGFENVIEVSAGKQHIWFGTMQAGVAGLSYGTDGKIGITPQLFQHNDQNENTISDNFVTGLWEDSKGYVWIGTFNGGLSIVDPKNYGKPGSVFNYRHDDNNANSLCDNGATSFLLEEDSSILMATFGGIDRISNAQQGYDNFQFEHLLSNAYCRKILKTQDGAIYVTTKLGLYKGVKNGEKYHFTKLSVLGDRNLTYMQEDKLGRLWVMSYDGLFFYDPRKDFVLQFRKEDGLPSSRSVMAGSAVQTPDGIMVFGNGEGLTIFDPLSLRINATKPKPILTSLRINNIKSSSQENKPIDLSESINTVKALTLDYTHQIVTFEFSAMDFTTPEKNTYQYKLEGFDENWITTDWKNRTATYTNLIPGNYTFRVKASNRDGVWSDYEKVLQINVLPPPWKTWWAYALYTLAVLGILLAAWRNTIQRERLASKLKLEHMELEKTQEVDRLRSTFFTNISHEFRTPLTLIQGPAQNMLDRLKTDKTIKPNEATNQLNLILLNANRLLRLVNQVLDLSKLESGGLKKEMSETDLFDFLKTVIDHFTLLSVQKRISLEYQFPNQHAITRIDKDKVEKILSNLIFNALKFTPDGGRILVAVDTINQDQQQLTIHVRDSGVGIPKDQIGRIFERFYQVKEGDNQNSGAGIGLALSKELAEFLGGSLSVVSSPSTGSIFTLQLPLEIVVLKEIARINSLSPLNLTPHEGSERTSVRSNENKSRPLLLIVEDHVDLRNFICLCLGDEYEYLEAGNGKDGLRLAVDELPSLIVSDIMMPEMDGVEMCNQLKHDHRTNHIPIILLTAKASEESKVHGLDKGADDYIIKPFNKDELILKIRNQILAQKRVQEKIRLELLSGSTIINPVSADEKFIARIKEIIEARISDEKLGVESLAEEIGLSRVQLYRKVNALTGISVNDFIRKLRLQKGAQLLASNWGNVAEIAYEVGFSNPSYFSKCFKDEFGVLPSSYSSQKV